MSSQSKTRKRQPSTGRVTAGKRSRTNHRSDLATFDGLCQELLATQGREVLRTGDPLEAEAWASTVIAMFAGVTLVGEPDPVAALGGRLVSVAHRNGAPHAQACLRALAAVGQGELRRKATAAVGASHGPLPGWVGQIGTARSTGSVRATDLYGDQDAVMIGFAYPNGSEHTLLVLIDHTMGGIAKDASLLLSPVADVVKQWSDVEDIELVEEAVGFLAARVLEAIDWTDRTIDPPVSEDYPEIEALVRSRLGPLAVSVEDVEPLGCDEREALVCAFLDDDAGTDFSDDPDAWGFLDALVDYRCDHHGGDPLRWSDTDVAMFLLDFVPRKISAPESSLLLAPEVLKAWVPWAAARAGLPARAVIEPLAIIDEVLDDFRTAIRDPGRWGPAKRIAMEMLDAGLDTSDLDAATDWLAERIGH
jgi:hypothetical protein